MQIPYLMQGSTKLILDTGKAEVVAETFAKSNTLTTNYTHSSDKKIISTVLNFKAAPINNEEESFTTTNNLQDSTISPIFC